MGSSIIRFVNIISVALLAGVSFGIWIGFNPMNLSTSTYIEQQQNMLNSLSVLMVSLVLTATIITIVSAFLHKKDKSKFIMLLLAALFLISCILITRFGIKSIDEAMMSWSPASPPANWKQMRNDWWNLHIMRTWTELIALALICWVTITRKHQ